MVVGLLGVFLAVQSEYATKANKLLIAAFPLMSASVVASGVSKLICTAPLYQALAERFSPPLPQQATAALPEDASRRMGAQ